MSCSQNDTKTAFGENGTNGQRKVVDRPTYFIFSASGIFLSRRHVTYDPFLDPSIPVFFIPRRVRQYTGVRGRSTKYIPPATCPQRGSLVVLLSYLPKDTGTTYLSLAEAIQSDKCFAFQLSLKYFIKRNSNILRTYTHTHTPSSRLALQIRALGLGQAGFLSQLKSLEQTTYPTYWYSLCSETEDLKLGNLGRLRKEKFQPTVYPYIILLRSVQVD